MLKIKLRVLGKQQHNMLFSIFFGCCFKMHANFLCLSSSHNWNSLFLGTSAVADAIAEKYNTTKSKVLDHVSEPTSEGFMLNHYISCLA